AVIRQAIDRGAEEILLDDAIARYQRREFGSGAASEAAGVSLIRFLQELRSRGLPFITDTEGMMEELRQFKAERRVRGARSG
ncbi:MAG TPA: UPF0175 family protein, partial [Thermoplasmata archaeon]|nr:UPF0175 family protein [Thermoplasmata archaeon]